jgi:uncharacterized protein (DUF2336 family)
MVVNHFLRWIDTASVAERAAAAAALARAYIGPELEFEDRCAAEAALTLLLDDPSPKVRYALAEALALSRLAPLQVIHALVADHPEIADLVIKRSPLLTDGDLIDRVTTCEEPVQRSIAERPNVSKAVAAALAEVGAAPACLALLRNEGADIAALSFRRIAERHGDVARLREAMLADPRLPADCRHLLLQKLATALKGSRLVLALVGKERGERITRDACLKASLVLIDRTAAEDHAALVEHLRLRGEITASFVVRLVAHGKIDFFGAVLSALTGKDMGRIRALLSGGRDLALRALFRAAGLAESTHDVIVRALMVWREVANGKRVAGTQEVSWLMLEALGATPGRPGPAPRQAELAALVRSIHLDALRENARGHALAIAAA